ncbi:translocation/assembly module TamB domain-containing protein [Candidatus Erwinia haradaeae]|uniref:Translocation and assembly module subunit TamB n=1 Tax=Candidatus Erwinia haradaeae TaxID=1922217 RepID=A0A451DLD3_9GAMM|nr:translocation/assembly module TamB domain-containing protein [Candidatus Erwinia haradaeae]VFP87526.1 Translocation and assembly module subunit TamB [Candidatus Erwinia haradaeae]
MKWFKKGLTFFFILSVLILCFIAFLVNTTNGMKLVLHTATKSISALHISTINGTLHDGVLTGVLYNTPGISINIDKVHFKLSYKCLMHKKLYVNELMLKKVNILIDNNWPSLQIANLIKQKNYKYNISYYPVILKKLALYKINIQIKKTGIYLASFIGGAKWQPHELTLTSSHMQGLTVSLPKTKTKKLNIQESIYNIKKPSIHLLSCIYINKIIQTLQKQILIQDLPIFHLPVHIKLMTIFCENLHFIGDHHISIYKVLIKATIKNQKLYLKNLAVNFPGGMVQSYGHITFHGTWPLNFMLHSIIHRNKLQPENIYANLNGDVYGHLKLKCKLSGSIQALVSLNAQLTPSGEQIYIQLQSSKLFWPLYGAIPLRANNVHFIFRGNLHDYSISLSADLGGQYIPSIMLIANGEGNADELVIKTLQLKSSKNITEFKGKINWKKSMNWCGELRFFDIARDKQNPITAPSLSQEPMTYGSLYTRKNKIFKDQIWQTKNLGIYFPITRSLLHHPLKIYGSLSTDSVGQCHIPVIKLNLGGNTITIKCIFNKQVNVYVHINAKYLEHFVTGLSGGAHGDIHAQGDLTKLRLLINLNANHLKWHKVQIVHMKLNGSIITNNKIQSEINLYAEKLKQNNMLINFFKLHAIGTVKKHILTINLQGNHAVSQITIQGSLDPIAGRWSGTCPNVYFSNTLGTWRSSNNITLDYLYEKQIFGIGPSSVDKPKIASSRLKIIKSNTFGDLKISLNHVNLAIFNMFMPVTTQLSGTLNTGYAHITLNRHTLLFNGTMSVIGNHIIINHNVTGHNIPIILNSFQVYLAFKNNCMQFKWRASIIHNGVLYGNIQVSDLNGERILLGDLNVDSLSIGLLNAILMPGETISGIINTHLHLGGSLKKPQVFGNMLLSNASFDTGFIPMKLSTAKVDILFNGVTSNLRGVMKTEQGTIIFHGITDWSQLNNWHTRISVTGNRVRCTVPPILKMDIIPDLTFEAAPKSLTLVGDIYIPWARFLLQTAPLTISRVSSDEILLDSDLKPIAPRSMTIPISSRLRIHIGNDVILKAFGLQGKLHGNLKITQNKKGLGLYGQIKILAGRFHAYAQDLTIRKGELQFSGLIDQPYLNIEAIRNPESTTDDVVAGVKITGLANDPKFEVFSDPEQTQESALSYLLRGQKLTSASNDSYALTSTLISIGLAHSESIISKIGKIVRVKNLSMATIGAGDKQQVQVSAYILPSLQIKYGFGIFDTLETLTLRCQLMPKLYLEAIYGLDQAIDILYQFEF